MSLGGKPRSLELEEDLGETSSSSRDAKSALKSINAVDSSTVSSKSTYRVVQEIHNQRENRLRDSLGKFIPLNKARSVYCWEVGANTKLYLDLALGNFLCLCGCKLKSEKKLFFSWPPMPLKIELLPRG